MHIIDQVLLLMVYLAVVVYCQRGDGGGSSGGGGSTGGGHYTSCKTAACRNRTSTRVACVFGGIVGFALLVYGIYYCINRLKGRPRHNNSVFINLINRNVNQKGSFNVSHFQSGIWSSRYFQDRRWHSYQFSLFFDSQSMKVRGKGSDEVGTFIIDGIYSTETNRIGLTKTYERGTGNLSANLGHQVIIQLTWNADRNQFEGKWYVRTYKYRGHGAVELKFEKKQLQP